METGENRPLRRKTPPAGHGPRGHSRGRVGTGALPEVPVENVALGRGSTETAGLPGTQERQFRGSDQGGAGGRAASTARGTLAAPPAPAARAHRTRPAQESGNTERSARRWGRHLPGGPAQRAPARPGRRRLCGRRERPQAPRVTRRPLCQCGPSRWPAPGTRGTSTLRGRRRQRTCRQLWPRRPLLTKTCGFQSVPPRRGPPRPELGT